MIIPYRTTRTVVLKFQNSVSVPLCSRTLAVEITQLVDSEKYEYPRERERYIKRKGRGGRGAEGKKNEHYAHRRVERDP